MLQGHDEGVQDEGDESSDDEEQEQVAQAVEELAGEEDGHDHEDRGQDGSQGDVVDGGAREEARGARVAGAGRRFGRVRFAAVHHPETLIPARGAGRFYAASRGASRGARSAR